MILLVFFGTMVFLSRKFDIFSLEEKMKEDLSQEIHGNTTFSVYMYKWYKYDISLQPKNIKADFISKTYV